MKIIQHMTREEFEAIPYRKSWDEEIICSALVILPAEINEISMLVWKSRKLLALLFKFVTKPDVSELRGIHDSGYRCMSFIAVNEQDQPICRMGGGSDIIHFDGIGGYGYDWSNKYGKIPDLIPPVGWNIDCLPESGLLRIFCNTGKMVCGADLSSFQIFHLPIKKEKLNDHF